MNDFSEAIYNDRVYWEKKYQNIKISFLNEKIQNKILP